MNSLIENIYNNSQTFKEFKQLALQQGYKVLDSFKPIFDKDKRSA